ncbi:hypothetical protein Tco_0120087 [Tanacetum coccineum]
MHNLFRGCIVTVGTSALQSVEGRSKGGDDVDGAAALIRTMDALVRGCMIRSGNGSGEDKCNGGGDAVLNRIPAAL